MTDDELYLNLEAQLEEIGDFSDDDTVLLATPEDIPEEQYQRVIAKIYSDYESRQSNG